MITRLTKATDAPHKVGLVPACARLQVSPARVSSVSSCGVVQPRLQILKEGDWEPKPKVPDSLDEEDDRDLMFRAMILTSTSHTRYVAHEYANTGLLNEKSDVYSFSVLLLEAVTGKDPIDYGRPANGKLSDFWLGQAVGCREEPYHYSSYGNFLVGEQLALQEHLPFLVLSFEAQNMATQVGRLIRCIWWSGSK